MAKKILLIEDDLIIQEMICDFFGANGWTVVRTDRGTKALEILKLEKICLILLDIMIPGMDGFETCKAIRAEYDLPVIYLTALEAEPMQLKGYETGADDYVTKPFSLPVLLAKVNALMKRVKKDSREMQRLCIGALSINPGKREVCYKDEVLTLADKEYQILLYLAQNQEHVLSREQILNHVWGDGTPVIDRVVDKHMVKLRNALGDAGGMIQTISKAGYVLKSSETA